MFRKGSFTALLGGGGSSSSSKEEKGKGKILRFSRPQGSFHDPSKKKKEEKTKGKTRKESVLDHTLDNGYDPTQHLSMRPEDLTASMRLNYRPNAVQSPSRKNGDENHNNNANNNNDDDDDDLPPEFYIPGAPPTGRNEKFPRNGIVEGAEIEFPQSHPTRLDLRARVSEFFLKHDPDWLSANGIENVVNYGLAYGEDALNIKLMRMTGGDKLRSKGSGFSLSASPKPSDPSKDSTQTNKSSPTALDRRKPSHIDLKRPRPLREQLRVFYSKFDSNKISQIDKDMSFVAQNGMDSLNQKLKSKYGSTVDDLEDEDFDKYALKPNSESGKKTEDIDESEVESSHFSDDDEQEQQPMKKIPPPVLPRQGSFVEMSSSSPGENKPTHTAPSPFHTSPEVSAKVNNDLSEIMKRLRLYYQEKDPGKTAQDKLLPISEWAAQVGVEELDARLSEKYDEGLLDFERRSTTQSTPFYTQNSSSKPVFPTTYTSSSTTKPTKPATTTYSPPQSSQSSVLPRKPSEVAASQQASRKPSNVTPFGAKAKPFTVQKKPASPFGQAKPLKTTSPVKQNTASKPVMPEPPSWMKKADAAKGPCSNFKLDMSGSAFGQCQCGFSKAEHTKTAPQLSKTLERKMKERQKKAG